MLNLLCFLILKALAITQATNCKFTHIQIKCLRLKTLSYCNKTLGLHNFLQSNQLYKQKKTDTEAIFTHTIILLFFTQKTKFMIKIEYP